MIKGKLKKIKKQGDVIFFEDDKGALYQQLGSGEPFKVRDGSITYKIITKINGYTIKYNNNGVYGFAIFKGATCLEDRFWVYEDALKAANKM
ncbi:MAG: hypothetical protein PHW82_17085 [Bacteroidales bacterium]|nr:hypothetical protein [Bacteroidales bacterium]